MELGLFDNSKGSPVLKLINGAKKTLDLEIYEMDDPKVIAAIRAALKRGVHVRIVKEPVPVGASCRVFEEKKDAGVPCADQQQLVEDVTEAGGEYVPFLKDSLCFDEGRQNCLQHGKLLIADSKYALVSSGNLNTSSLCDLDHGPNACNRDYSFITNNASDIQAFTTIVTRDIAGKYYDVSEVLGEAVQKRISVGPNSLQPLVTLIRSAKRTIQLQNQYLKDPSLNKALVDAARKGVKVEVSLASACSFGKPKPNDVKKLTAIFTEFDNAGIKTSMFTKNIKLNGKNGYLHAKAIIVDGKKAWMGSVNGSTQAATMNREFGVFFETPSEVTELSEIMNQDFYHPKSESWSDSLECAENKHL